MRYRATKGPTMSKALERRLQIMALIEKEESAQDIADKLGCSLGAVRRTVKSWGEWKEDPPKPAKLSCLAGLRKYTKS